MKWIAATEWFGSNNSSLWASDGNEIFRVQYRESDICETPEERLFLKQTAKVWLDVIYIWSGVGKPNCLPADTLAFIKNFRLSDLLNYRFPGLDRKTFDSLYAKLLEKLPRLPSAKSVMEEAL